MGNCSGCNCVIVRIKKKTWSCWIDDAMINGICHLVMEGKILDKGWYRSDKWLVGIDGWNDGYRIK
jgi:hypothetical protein